MLLLCSVALVPPLYGNSAAQNDMVEWREYNFGMEKAQKDILPAMLDFYTDWCSYCQLMDENTYSDPDVIAKSKSFVAIKIDAEERTDIASKYEISGYPTIVFVMPDGKVISKVVGYTEVEPFLEEMDNALKYFNENRDSAQVDGAADGTDADSEDSKPVGIFFIIGFIVTFLIMVVVISRMKQK